MDVLVRQVLEAYRRTTAPPIVRSVPRDDMQGEMDWLARPDPNFIGQSVALQGSQVIASGPDPNTIYEQVRGERNRERFCRLRLSKRE